MNSIAVATLCVIILTAAPRMKLEKCFSDRSCAGLLSKSARVWNAGDAVGQAEESIPMFFGCDRAPKETKDEGGSVCEKKITKCCPSVLKKDDSCALVGFQQSHVFNRKEGRFCVTCKASEAPVVTRMSTRFTEVCRAEGEKVYVNKCHFEEAGICIPIGTYALKRKDVFYDPVLICPYTDNIMPLTQPKAQFFASKAPKPGREVEDFETTCYKNSDGLVEPVVKKCRFTYEGKFVCVREGYALVIPGNAEKYAAFTCSVQKDVVGQRLSKSEHAEQEPQLKQSFQYVPNEVSFEVNPAAQCYGI